MNEAPAIGVDLGGTKLLCGVIGSEAEILSCSRASSAGLAREDLLELLYAQLEGAVEAHSTVEAIGLGLPCTIDHARGICVNAVHLDLAGVPLGDLVSDRLGLPVFCDNDGNLAAIAEQRYGAARGERNVVLLTIGTGIGGGLILDGRPYRGSRGAGAELGHIVVDLDGPECGEGCPNRGCIEAMVSGRALAQQGRLAAGADPSSPLGRQLAAGGLDGAAVTSAALAGDPAAVAAVETIGRRLGTALAGLANAFDPDRIVVGGGVMAAGELLLDPAREELRERALPPQNEVPVTAAALGEHAGMIGAATMARDELARTHG
ncbi:MAG: ROK family protein [Solirubrobacterales bacterium]